MGILFYCFLPARPHLQTHDRLLLMERKLFCTYYPARGRENWIVVVPLTSFQSSRVFPGLLLASLLVP